MGTVTRKWKPHKYLQTIQQLFSSIKRMVLVQCFTEIASSLAIIRNLNRTRLFLLLSSSLEETSKQLGEDRLSRLEQAMLFRCNIFRKVSKQFPNYQKLTKEAVVINSRSTKLNSIVINFQCLIVDAFLDEAVAVAI